MSRRALSRGFWAGIVAGTVTIALMYVASALLGVQALPQSLQDPLLRVMPGPVFGFLIDRLQHAGKVLEEIGILLGMILACGGLGALQVAAEARLGVRNLALAAGALLFLLVGLLALPAGGLGLFGLQAGLTTPVVWALLAAIYAFVVELTRNRLELAPEETGAGTIEADPGRRRALLLLPAILGGVGLGVIGLIKVPGWVQSVYAPPEAGLVGPAPELTPARDFYQVSKNLSDPSVASDGWSLSIHGLVDSPQKITYHDLLALPGADLVATLECVSNPVGGQLLGNGQWSGTPLRDVLAMAHVQTAAGAVAFRAADGFTESITLPLVMGDPGIMLVHSLNGAPLPKAHGFPARILIPGHYGMRGPKWLTDIEVTRTEGSGYWEGQGWSHPAVVKTMSRIDSPSGGTILRRSTPAQISGVAFAGDRGVTAVEWSADGGKTWSPAELSAPLSTRAWTLWNATWTPPAEGAFAIVVRARDGGGALQDSNRSDTYPDGATGYHVVQVTVGS